MSVGRDVKFLWFMSGCTQNRNMLADFTKTAKYEVPRVKVWWVSFVVPCKRTDRRNAADVGFHNRFTKTPKFRAIICKAR